jgi:hypothetical protein
MRNMDVAYDRATPTPSSTKVYEVQRHSEGRWLVDTVSDDREVAIALAKSLMGGRRAPSGVRVMAVMMTDNGKFSEVSVYRSTMLDKEGEAAPAPKPKIEAKPKPAQEQREFKHAERPKEAAKKKAFGIVQTLQFAFGLGVVLAALEALNLMMR